MKYRLFKQKSTRVRNTDNRPFVDFYIGWVYEGRPYVVRVRPQFNNEYELLLASAEDVPNGEPIEKYL